MYEGVGVLSSMAAIAFRLFRMVLTVFFNIVVLFFKEEGTTGINQFFLNGKDI